MGRSHGAGSAVPKVSHAEAEGLISARLDAPLDSAQAQMLAVHLRDCPACRQFADQMESMRTGFRSLPHLPASPIVSRQVRERIAQPGSIWERIGGLFGSGSALGPMAASAALILLVIASYALITSMDDSGEPTTITAKPALTATATMQGNAYAATSDTSGQDIPPAVTPGSLITPSAIIIDVRANTPEPTTGNVLASEPTNTVQPTSTEEPTEEPTDVPTETATERPTRTATTEPSSTAEPSATREPSRTPTDEPTATEVPSRTPTDEPTATDEPTSTKAPTRTPTEEPTETEEPTSTPTDEPTATDEPTETEEPSSTPTEEPTEEIAPTIEPIDSTLPVDEPTVAEEDGEDEPTEASQDDPGEPTNIEPVDTPEDTPETGDDPRGGDNTESAEEGSSALDNADLIAGLPENIGAPTGPLRVNISANWMVLSSDPSGSDLLVASMVDGTIVANLGPAANPIWSPLGLVLLYQDFSGGTPAAAIFEADTGAVRRISDPDSAGAVQDVPAGWSGEWAYYLRQMPDGSISLLGRNVNTDEEILVWDGGGRFMGGARPIPITGGFLIPTDSEWLQVGTDGSEQSLGSNDYGISGEGFLSPYESLIAYPAGGALIIASTESPGLPIAQIPYSGGSGSGFSWRPDGEYLVVSDGGRLELYTADGQYAGEATSSGGVQIASPQWLDAGIYYVESSPSSGLRLTSSDSFSVPGE